MDLSTGPINEYLDMVSGLASDSMKACRNQHMLNDSYRLRIQKCMEVSYKGDLWGKTMNQQLQQRLNEIPEKILAEEFLKSQGLGNEIGF